MKEITTFDAMATTATNKYVDLINGMYRMKDDPELFNRNINLINSIYKDQMELLVRLCTYELKERKKSKWELKIPSFMCKEE